MRLIGEESAHNLHTHSPSVHRRSRQSRGLRNRSDDVFPARSRTLGWPCDHFEERDRDASDPFLLPNTPSTSTRTLPASSSAFTGSPPVGHFLGCRPGKLETSAFHDAPVASADRTSCVEGIRLPRFSPGPDAFVGRTSGTRTCDRASGIPVATFASITGARLSRCARADSAKTAKTASISLP